MEVWELVVTIVCSVITSSGLWTYLMKRYEKHDANTELLKALARDRILHLAQVYLDRGDWITLDEYENLRMLYEPYVKQGGNGVAKRVFLEVENTLHIVDNSYPSTIKTNH